jgi:hypothetical protein
MRIAIDNVPSIARPPEIERAIGEARELRDRQRLAQEELAQAQQAFEQAQEADVAATAAKVRQGSAPGAVPAAVAKTKTAVEVSERNARAIGLAHEQAEQDVVSAIAERADTWTVALEAEVEHAREQGHVALAALEDALARIGGAGSAQNWLAAALVDGRYDRPSKPILSFALSSRERTANNEPIGVSEALGYVAELLAPPTPPEPAGVLDVDAA